ncbi:unnamed protein product [Bursaphelenchus xylophilus]|uniref:(pine wood nematode) hypothetical protein n=1 Tax=Bursaphelenchus xylophilus TaxID=6326 RepID=A0A1I7S484_BURXY|nr:unnamed protein product [Bursaphelenchus xylophilus]CAG9116828.1 unnamed protein product [Bursaphelenchus xylophilus]
MLTNDGQDGQIDGFKVLNVNMVDFAIPTNYTFVDHLGSSNYGNVIKVRRTDGQEFAIKKMYEPFRNPMEARRVYRELKLLRLLNHDNVIRFVGAYTPDTDINNLKNVFIVTEYAGVSLKYVLDRQKCNDIRLINDDHIKYIIYQLLRALKYLHSADVIHRDLKPSNLALTEECDLTVVDFCLARTLSNNDVGLTAYVISRWYRSPEVIYWNHVSYNFKADVWSVGCILSELFTGKVVFKGSEAIEQYRLIVNLCGSPDAELMDKIETQNNSSMRMVVEALGGGCVRQDFRKYFAGLPEDAIDLLDKILVLDPDRRISVEEALQHPYMAQYSMPSDEPLAPAPFVIDDGDYKKDVNYWKECVWSEIEETRSPALANAL